MTIIYFILILGTTVFVHELGHFIFAKKYGVTYQAVSKWENGKNIPDISLLKQISEDFNIDIKDLLDGKKSEIKKVDNSSINIEYEQVFNLGFAVSKVTNEIGETEYFEYDFSNNENRNICLRI